MSDTRWSSILALVFLLLLGPNLSPPATASVPEDDRPGEVAAVAGELSSECGAILRLSASQWLCILDTHFTVDYCNGQTGDDPFEQECGLP